MFYGKIIKCLKVQTVRPAIEIQSFPTNFIAYEAERWSVSLTKLDVFVLFETEKCFCQGLTYRRYPCRRKYYNIEKIP